MKEIDVLFLGDSLVKRAPWEDLFPNYSTFNYGLDGDTTLGLMGRLERLPPLSPRCILILIGMNNLLSAYCDYPTLLNKVRDKFPKSDIAFLSITPAGGREYLLNEDIDTCNEYLRRLCIEEKLTYIDIHSPLLEFGGGIKGEYTLDGIHLTYLAYDEVKKAILPYLESKLGK